MLPSGICPWTGIPTWQGNSPTVAAHVVDTPTHSVPNTAGSILFSQLSGAARNVYGCARRGQLYPASWRAGAGRNRSRRENGLRLQRLMARQQQPCVCACRDNAHSQLRANHSAARLRCHPFHAGSVGAKCYQLDGRNSIPAAFHQCQHHSAGMLRQPGRLGAQPGTGRKSRAGRQLPRSRCLLERSGRHVERQLLLPPQRRWLRHAVSLPAPRYAANAVLRLFAARERTNAIYQSDIWISWRRFRRCPPDHHSRWRRSRPGSLVAGYPGG